MINLSKAYKILKSSPAFYEHVVSTYGPINVAIQYSKCMFVHCPLCFLEQHINVWQINHKFFLIRLKAAHCFTYCA
jgi:hypothetical protein